MVRDSGGAWHSLFTKRRGTSSKYVCFTFSCELGDSCVGIARREGIGDIRPVLERLAFRMKIIFVIFQIFLLEHFATSYIRYLVDKNYWKQYTELSVRYVKKRIAWKLV